MAPTTRPPEGEVVAEYLGDPDVKLPLVVGIRASFGPFIERVPQMKVGSIWAALLTQDVAFLTDLRDRLGKAETNEEFMDFVRSLGHIQHSFPPLLRLFRGAKLVDYVDANAGERDGEVCAEARMREGNRCAILGTAEPQVCHIFPSTAVHHRFELSESLASMGPLFGRAVTERLLRKLVCDKGQRVNNGIALDRRLHKLWVEGRFALEPLGPPSIETVPADHHLALPVIREENEDGYRVVETGPARRWCLRLRFHWMKRTRLGKMNAPMDFNTHPFHPDHYEASSVGAYLPVADGQIVEIFAKDAEDLPDRDVLWLQSKLISIWSLQGGVDPALYRFAFRDGYWPEPFEEFLRRIRTLASEERTEDDLSGWEVV